MAWSTNGRLTNPTASAVLADTGPQQASTIHPQIVASTTVNCAILLEHRNAADTATLKSHIFPVAANTNYDVTLAAPIDVASGERIRLIMNAGVTGSVQGSLFAALAGP